MRGAEAEKQSMARSLLAVAARSRRKENLSRSVDILFVAAPLDVCSGWKKSPSALASPGRFAYRTSTKQLQTQCGCHVEQLQARRSPQNVIPTFLSPSIRSSSSVTPARTSSTQHARSKRRYQKLQLWAGRSGTRASGLGRGNEKPTARHHTHIIRGSGQRGIAVGAAAPSVSAISGAFHSPRDSSLTREESTGLARPLHLGSSPSRRMAEAPARLFQPVTLLCARPLRGPRNPLHFCFFPPFAD